MFLLLLFLSVTPWSVVGATQAHSTSGYSSADKLLLSARELPAHFRLVSSFTQDSVITWDGNVKQIVAIDERNGWLEAAQESVRDRLNRPVEMSVQVFQSHAGAMRDFGQFFTDSHPETIYVPGQHWLGGAAAPGFGDRATLYRIQDDFSRCPGRLTTGLSFVYRTALFSVAVCSRPGGETAARELAGRLLARAMRFEGR